MEHYHDTPDGAGLCRRPDCKGWKRREPVACNHPLGFFVIEWELGWAVPGDSVLATTRADVHCDLRDVAQRVKRATRLACRAGCGEVREVKHG